MKFNNAQDGARKLSIAIIALISATVHEGFTSIYDVISLDPINVPFHSASTSGGRVLIWR